MAASGGPDSIALLDMLVRLLSRDRRPEIAARESQPPTPNPQLPAPIPHLHVAHLDHMLRGGESAEDAEFVRALAERLGLQITVRAADVRAVASRFGRGIEEIAREIRYDFLMAVAREAGCDRIAVGHTMTDQAETFLMRLIRGAGLRGLAAMRPVAPAHDFRRAREEKAEGSSRKAVDGTQATDSELPPSAFFVHNSACVPPSISIIRPLLCITREEVESYCRERGLQFRTDSSNLSLHYTRNRVRGDILPILRSINPRVVESISRATEAIGADQDVLDGFALSLLANARLAPDTTRRIVDGKIDAYSITELLKQPAGMRRRIIIEAIRLKRLVGSDEVLDDVDGEITSAHIAAVENLLTPGASGKHIALPCSLEVWREFDALVIKTSVIKEAPYRLVISSARPDVEAGGFAFALRRGLAVGMLDSVIEGARLEKQATGRDWMTVALDDRALPEHMVVRPRLRGERAQVIGERRTIKLKNLMIDHRIPSSRRATWPLVTTPDGSYIWSPGLPPSLEFAAHEGAQGLATMRASAI